MAMWPAYGGSYGRIGPFLYGIVAGLRGLIWLDMAASPMALWPACEGSYGRIWSYPHMVPSPMEPRQACEGSYSHIGFFFPMARSVLARRAALTNHHHSYHCTRHAAYDNDW